MSSTSSSNGRASLGADLVIPVLALGFAVYFFVSIADLAWEAKANGVLIGTVLLILIAIQIARVGVDYARHNGAFGFDALLQPRAALVKRCGMVLLTAAFIFALKWLGLTLSLVLGLASGLYLMGVRKWQHLIYVPLIAAAAAYLLFIAALDADFPRGPLEHLLAALS